MPFADGSRRVAEGFETIGYGFLRQRQAEALTAGWPAAVELVAEAGLITAGHQARARGAAIRAGDVALRESNAGLGQRINVRRGDFLVTLESILAIADIVGEEHNDIGFARFSSLGRPDRGAGENDRQPDAKLAK